MAQQLDANLILRLIREEYLMKPGESDGFTLNIHGKEWAMTLKRESEFYAPFKYALSGKCSEASPIGTYATVSRRFTTLDAALLHCLNGFNENANVPNIYKSIEDALTLK